MIKKQLGLLAGSVMVAATSNAAITLGSDTLAVFNTAGAGSYYQLVTGSTAAGLVAGTGFSVDLSAATAALGGTIESFALFALNSNEFSAPSYPGYNYSEGLYVEEGGGLVYAGTSAVSTTNLDAQNTINAVQQFLSNASLGLNGEGGLADFDADSTVAGFLNSGQFSIIFNQQTLGGATNAQVISGLYTFGPPIPIPTTAWLFGSALAGLLVAKKKHKNSIN
ncbi:hypothetical protein N9N07_04565, partial [Pseudomonadales bacterium]|nr:hypothetical protein [Pseudomonadales bacterium]